MKDNSTNIEEMLAEKIRELGLPEEFFSILNFEDDDWSFVIKLHSLIEASATEAITKYFGEPKLRESFSNLEIGNKRSGKIKLLSSLGMIPNHFTSFIYTFGELRNELVHNIANISFSFKNPNKNSLRVEEKRKALIKATQRMWRHGFSKEDPGTSPLVYEDVESMSRYMIYIATEWCLINFILTEKYGEAKRSRANLVDSLFGKKEKAT